MENIPKKQQALQLVGPDQLKINNEKDVIMPGPRQVLGKVVCTNICFSDLKLLKQFSAHPRKSEIIAGIEQEALAEFPSYVTGEKPTVPGHETVVDVVAVGDDVTTVKEGARYLVQADFRWLKTEQANGAFGYNIEGGLQEYVLFDERVYVSPDGDSMLISAPTDISASAVALVEPWACVEDSYVASDRNAPLVDGTVLVCVSAGVNAAGIIAELNDKYSVGKILLVGGDTDAAGDNVEVVTIYDVKPKSMSDIVFVGNDADLLEKLFGCLDNAGLINIVRGANEFGRDIKVPVGRVHYGGIRITGTSGNSVVDGYEAIPASGEIRENDVVNIIGAGGPMGFMHVIRDICQGVSGVTICAGELDAERIKALSKVAQPLAEKNGVAYKSYNPVESPMESGVDYATVMVPIPAIVAAAVKAANDNGIINIFAGIMAQVEHPIAMDTYINRKLYFIGTSGSLLEDMMIVLKKVTERTLDTNLSIAAVSGIDGAIDGIRATENRTIPGKITVYPQCKGMGLTLLHDLAKSYPEVAECLVDGFWTKEAEDKLLEKWK